MGYLESLTTGMDASSIILKSPAKINLHLRVLDERPDGYHNLENLMQTINLCDEVVIRLVDRSGVTVECDNGTVPKGEDNIAFKSAIALLRKIGSDQGVSISIRKIIPMGAGLGGGSSNAGTVLLGLNHLLGSPLDINSLRDIAIGLGSDVPFFLYGGLALCRGKGELVDPLDPLEEFWIVLVTPRVNISTRGIYESYRKNALTFRDKTANLLKCDVLKQMDNPASELYNDLENVVIREYPEVRDAWECLKASGCEHVMVTGSGSSVFGLCDSRAHSARVSSGLRKLLGKKGSLIVEASNRL